MRKITHIDNLFLPSQQEMYSGLSCYILSGKYWGWRFKNIYDQAFLFWHSHWAKAFSEINIEFSSTSEEFCRHEQFIALVYQDQIVALAMMDCFNISNPIHRRHSYFSNYPDHILEKIKSHSDGKPVLTFGYLAVDQNFRKNYHLADIVLGVAVKNLVHSSFPLMITYTRNTRRTHELTYRLGATSIERNINVRGEGSDFVFFSKDSLAVVNQHACRDVIQNLWDSRNCDTKIILSNEQLIKGDQSEEFNI